MIWNWLLVTGVWGLVGAWGLVMGVGYWVSSGSINPRHRLGHFSGHALRFAPATIRHSRFADTSVKMIALHRLGWEDIMSIAISAPYERTWITTATGFPVRECSISSWPAGMVGNDSEITSEFQTSVTQRLPTALISPADSLTVRVPFSWPV